MFLPCQRSQHYNKQPSRSAICSLLHTAGQRNGHCRCLHANMLYMQWKEIHSDLRRKCQQCRAQPPSRACGCFQAECEQSGALEKDGNSAQQPRLNTPKHACSEGNVSQNRLEKIHIPALFRYAPENPEGNMPLASCNSCLFDLQLLQTYLDKGQHIKLAYPKIECS